MSRTIKEGLGQAMKWPRNEVAMVGPIMIASFLFFWTLKSSTAIVPRACSGSVPPQALLWGDGFGLGVLGASDRAMFICGDDTGTPRAWDPGPCHRMILFN